MRLVWQLLCFILSLFLLASTALANDKVLNIYVWYGEVSDQMVTDFEKETGIKVNFSTYDDNETLYAKMRASPASGYDIIEPSSYYVDRMWREGMLQKIDKSRLANYKNIDPEFSHPAYDPKSEYSIPYLWGITGIFVNKKYFNADQIHDWNDLWKPRYRNQIMLLNDPREVFSMALIDLGYSANDSNPEHIRQAYLHLKALLPNIKLFNSDAIPAIFIDEDANLGMAWNGDIFRAQQTNPNLTFIYPQSGFVIWVDNFAIPRHAPHLENAYKFLNFMLRGSVASQATLEYGYATANTAARKLLPESYQHNPLIYPSKTVLKHGQFQTDIGDEALALYAKYWEMLKIGA